MVPLFLGEIMGNPGPQTDIYHVDPPTFNVTSKINLPEKLVTFFLFPSSLKMTQKVKQKQQPI